MQKRLKPTGFRKVDNNIRAMEKLCDKQAKACSVSRSEARTAFKRAAPYLKTNHGQISLIDLLFSFTKDCDWESGQLPIVWPSNQKLCDKTGYSMQHIKRQLALLARAGMIAFKDSPNGHRYGHRDEEGYIIEAYGIDLSPLALQAGSYHQLYLLMSEEERIKKACRKHITIARRKIREVINKAFEEDYVGDWLSFEDRLDGLIILNRTANRSIEGLQSLRASFDELLNEVQFCYDSAGEVKEYELETSFEFEVEELAESMEKELKMRPKGLMDATHITTTTQPPSVNCSDANAPPNRQDYNRLKVHTPQKAKENEDSIAPIVSSSTSPSPEPASLQHVWPEMLLDSCPSFADWVGAGETGSNKGDWREIKSTAEVLRPQMGISVQAWTEAKQVMGSLPASACLALIVEKHSQAEIHSPGGYLRGMTLKAQTGELNLHKSIIARTKG